MNKVFVHIPSLQRVYKAWITPEYSFAQLKRDVASYCSISVDSCRLDNGNSEEYPQNGLVLGFLPSPIYMKMIENDNKNNFKLHDTQPVLEKTSMNCIEMSSIDHKETTVLQLKEIFYTYIIQGGTSDILLLKHQQFCKLMQDCNIHRKLSLEKLSLIYHKCCSNATGLNFDQFLDSLVDISNSCNSNIKFQDLILHYIVPNASNINMGFSIPWIRQHIPVEIPSSLLEKKTPPLFPPLSSLEKKRTSLKSILKKFKETAKSFCHSISSHHSNVIFYSDYTRLMGYFHIESLPISGQEIAWIFLYCSGVLLTMTSKTESPYLTVDALLDAISIIAIEAFPRTFLKLNDNITKNNIKNNTNSSILLENLDRDTLLSLWICLIKAFYQHVARYLTPACLKKLFQRHNPPSDNLIACISTFQKKFLAMWNKDGCPDYIDVAENMFIKWNCTKIEEWNQPIKKSLATISNEETELNVKEQNTDFLISSVSSLLLLKEFSSDNCFTKKLEDLLDSDPALHQFLQNNKNYMIHFNWKNKSTNIFDIEYSGLSNHELNNLDSQRAEQLYMAAAYLLLENKKLTKSIFGSNDNEKDSHYNTTNYYDHKNNQSKDYDRKDNKKESQNYVLDLWVMAGDEFNRAIAVNEEKSLLTANLLTNWGNSLTIFARQILSSEFNDLRNNAIWNKEHVLSGNTSEKYKEESIGFSIAIESLILASSKFYTAMKILQQFDKKAFKQPSSNLTNQNKNQSSSGISSNENERYGESMNFLSKLEANCLFLWSNALCLHGEAFESNFLKQEDDLWIHNHDKKEEFQEEKNKKFVETCSSWSLPLHRNNSLQFYDEACHRLKAVVELLPNWIPARNNLAYTQYKLGMLLSRGSERSKMYLDLALKNAKACAMIKPMESSYNHVVQLIEAQIFITQHFFSSVRDSIKENHWKTRIHPDDISPLYRLTLTSLFERFDVDQDGILVLEDINRMNLECGENPISIETMEWLQSQVDSTINGITLIGLMQYYCFTAMYDPIRFKSVLDALTECLDTKKGSNRRGTSTTSTAISTNSNKLIHYLENNHRNTHESSSSSSSSTLQTPEASLLLNNETSSHSTTKLFNTSLLQRSTSIGDMNSYSFDDGYHARLADYFLVVSCNELSSDFTLTETTSPLDLRLEPKIEHQYPVISHSDTPLPQELHKFCFPDGSLISSKLEDPSYFDLVLTDVNGVKLYATCFRFYEKMDPLQILALIVDQMNKSRENSGGSWKTKEKLPDWVNLGDLQKERTQWNFYSPKCLCLVSHYPFYSTFRDFLSQLYRIARSSPPIPIERYILNFMQDVPLPPKGHTRIQFTIGDKTCYLQRPSPNQLPFIDVSFKPVFQCLSCENILKVYLCMLTEKKLAFCSSNYAVLTPIAEAFRALLFPFECQTIYIPVLPKELYEFLYAPVPFLMGIHTKKNQKRDRIDDVVYVYLDLNEIHVPEGDTLPRIGEGKTKKIIYQLKKLAQIFLGNATVPLPTNLGSFSPTIHDTVTDFALDRSHTTVHPLHGQSLSRSETEWNTFVVENEVRFEFLKIHANLFKNYRKYFVKNRLDHGKNEIFFDKTSFLNDHLHSKEILSQIFETQLFEKFIEQRLDKCTWNLPSINFFDEFILRLTLKFKYQLKKDFVQEAVPPITQTFVAPPPNTFGVSHHQIYHYTGFPRLQVRFYEKKETDHRMDLQTMNNKFAYESLSKTAQLANAARIRVEGSAHHTVAELEDVLSFIGKIIVDILLYTEVECARRQNKRSQVETLQLRESLTTAEQTIQRLMMELQNSSKINEKE